MTSSLELDKNGVCRCRRCRRGYHPSIPVERRETIEDAAKRLWSHNPEEWVRMAKLYREHGFSVPTGTLKISVIDWFRARHT
ncbi:hypothetical protein PhaeoP72_01169 [Phaeobacter inhibens]|nr:hypothetical protein PhaeoP72_01169 [Phaeobacter inhibens]